LTATDNLHQLLRSRRSIRRFTAEPVPVPIIEDILTTATHAPSAHNRQPWRFYVITSLAAKHCLAEALAADFRRDLTADGVAPERISTQIERSHGRITSAPLVIILSMDLSDMDSYLDKRRAQAERDMALQSVAAAGTFLLLAAHARGLGGSWVCSPLFAPAAVRKVLDLPDAWEPQAMFLLGYPDEQPREKQLRPLAEVARFDTE
jgi:F420 biosynthesis protein FbiB-like protein